MKYRDVMPRQVMRSHKPQPTILPSAVVVPGPIGIVDVLMLFPVVTPCKLSAAGGTNEFSI